MANLCFPQLTSGSLAQYPIRKGSGVRTVKNILPNGDMILYADAGGSKRVWELSYANLATPDMQAIQAHFGACSGPLRAFTFIDPTENMLVWSTDLNAATWNIPTLVSVVAGAADPLGGAGAFVVTNTGEAPQEVSQTLAAPSNYQYCFSAYAMASRLSSVALSRRGVSQRQDNTVEIGPSWNRVLSSGQMTDSGQQLTIAITLQPGQQVTLFGPQLEPQTVPSSYRPTTTSGGVYANAHWANDELTIVADGPESFSASFSIETAL